MTYTRPCRRCNSAITETKSTAHSAIDGLPTYTTRVACRCAEGECTNADKRAATRGARAKYWRQANAPKERNQL